MPTIDSGENRDVNGPTMMQNNHEGPLVGGNDQSLSQPHVTDSNIDMSRRMDDTSLRTAEID